MTSPEYPVWVGIEDSPNLLRMSMGEGPKVIKSDAALFLLANRDVAAELLKQQVDARSLAKITSVLLHASENDKYKNLREFSHARQAGVYVGQMAEEMKQRGIDSVGLLGKGLSKEDVAQNVLLYYDMGVGMSVIPRIVDRLDFLSAVHEHAPIDDEKVIDAIRIFRDDPQGAVKDAVDEHRMNAIRASAHAHPLYVPEFVRRGMQQGFDLFSSAYDVLSSYPTHPYLADF